MAGERSASRRRGLVERRGDAFRVRARSAVTGQRRTSAGCGVRALPQVGRCRRAGVGAVRIEPVDDAMFRERDAWRYEPPYDFYDSDGLPVKNPEFFFATRDDDGTLIGFYFLEPRDGSLFYGFGMRPDLTGRGLGEQFVLAGLEFARLRYGVRRVVLDVAAFNARAIRLYRRLGFDETGRHVETFDRYGAVEFIDMERLDAAEPG
jgi:ribosomal-protein-alanine N-acetyltransferase